MRGRWRGALAPLLVACLTVLALVAAGCGERRSQEAPAADAPGAALVVTADYGARGLLSSRVEPGQSVMRALRGATEVETRYAGAFVAGMYGLGSDRAGMRDWFFFVNGVSSPESAKDVTLADGDGAWWDHRDWSRLFDTPAVVGQWPAPLALPDGRGPRVAADPPLRAALAGLGANLTDGPSPWRAVVGESEALARRDPAWRRALDDPDAAGLTVTIRDGAVVAFGAGGGPRAPVAGARALIAAVPADGDPSDGVVVVVAGLDAAAAAAAAEALAADPGIVAQRYALALDGAGRPRAAGGRDGP